MKDYIKFFRSIGVLKSIGLIINFVFYRLKYIDKHEYPGYFLVKRRWVWYVATPIIVPFLLLFALFACVQEYFNGINRYYMARIEDHDQKLSLRKKIIYRRQLWD